MAIWRWSHRDCAKFCIPTMRCRRPRLTRNFTSRTEEPHSHDLFANVSFINLMEESSPCLLCTLQLRIHSRPMLLLRIGSGSGAHACPFDFSCQSIDDAASVTFLMSDRVATAIFILVMLSQRWICARY